ncbi:MAG: hypothetical protein ACRELX_17665, partial [Longimicrobiales bacterium]
MIVAIGFFAWLPLRDVLAYPDRVAVLPNLQADAQTYYELGREVAETGSLRPLPARHPPVWVAVLAAVFAVTGASFVAAKLVLWAALLASIAGCAWLARRVYSTAAAWPAALLCASSPALRGYVGTVQYEVFTGALLLLVLVLAARAAEASSVRMLLRRAM